MISIKNQVFMKIKLLFTILLLNVYLLSNAASPPNTTISYNTPFCQSSTVETVTITGTTGGVFSASPFSLSINAITGTIDPSASVPGTYAVTYATPPGPDPPFVTTTLVTILEQPNAGIDGSVTVCDTSTEVINLFSLISGEQPGGTWVRVIGTGGTFNAVAGTFTPAMGATISSFQYTIVAPFPCVSDTSVATLNITSQPNAGTDGVLSVCSSNSAIDLYSMIAGEQTGGVWSRTSGIGGSFNAVAGTFIPSSNSTTSTFTYTIIGVAPCVNDSSLVTITIISEMSPNFAQIAAICQGATPPTLPLVSPNGISGYWSPSAINTQIAGTSTYTFTPDFLGLCFSSQSLTVTVVPTIVPSFTFPTAILCAGNAPVLPTTSDNGVAGIWTPSTITGTGAYFFTPNLTNCATSIVTNVTVLAPYATISGSTTVCTGSSATVAFTGTPNSIVSYTTDSGPMQTIVLNTSGTATITTPTVNVNTAVCLVSVTLGNCTTPLSGCAIITVALNVVIPPMPDVVECGQYILPPLQIGNYYTEPNGGGTLLHAGDIITNTQFIYVYLSGSCSSNEESFVVTVLPIVNPTISTVDGINYIIVEGDQIVQPLELNTEVQSGNYSYQWIEFQNDIIGATSPSYTVNNLVTGGVHYYWVRITNNDTNCVTQSPAFQVLEIPVPAPIGDPNQTFILGQSLADIIVSGQNIQWYNVFNRNVNSNPLPLNTPLVEGVTYYATQTINGYESASAFEITIQFLANNTFAFKDLKFNPNPVQDVLHIQSKDLIEDVTVFNIMSQKILQQNCDSLDLRLQLSQLKAGNYFVKLESDNKSQVIKVIKN